MRRAVGLLGGADNLPEGFGYTLKRRLLGPPLVNEQLSEERLSKPLALGVLSCDGISSANYGSELILHELLPFFGLASFTILMPMTGVIILGIALVVLSYREVVSVYTRAGGSYVVARENFGPRVAQIAAVALMVDYVVTVAVQTAAGSAAIVSTFPALGRPLGDTTTLLLIAVVATLVMCYVNLRGVRENGRTFGLPTYLFTGSVGLMIIVGLAREAFGGGLPHVMWHAGTVKIGHWSGLYTLLAGFYLARAFANGGSSLTGIEAVSNAVSALRPPEGRNARQLLVIQGSIVAFLIAGISWFAHITHAVPYKSGVPTVVSQEAKLIFGSSLVGHILFFLVQAGAITILFTGGNTSFSGFPFLTSFVAEDSFLPRWLSKRGHRLVFSNGIVVLTVLALALLLVVGANTNNLVPFYAIGVFTGFSMAGFGMAKYHIRTRELHWRRKLAINLTGGVYTALVVLIFAIVKFTEGAWLVLVVFPILVFAFIRLNREYGMEAQVLERISDRPKPPAAPNYTRRTVFVFVDSFDLATIAALRYARSLRPTTLRAVHFVIDTARGRRPARGVDPGGHGRGAGLHRLSRPENRPGRGRTGQRGGGPAGHAGHGGAAPAQLLAADRPAAARPHRRQDRRGGEPDPARGRDHRPVRRAEQTGGPARPPGRAGRAGRRGQDEPQGPRGTGGQGRRGGPGAPAGTRPRHQPRGPRSGRRAGPGRRGRRPGRQRRCRRGHRPLRRAAPRHRRTVRAAPGAARAAARRGPAAPGGADRGSSQLRPARPARRGEPDRLAGPAGPRHGRGPGADRGDPPGRAQLRTGHRHRRFHR